MAAKKAAKTKKTTTRKAARKHLNERTTDWPRFPFPVILRRVDGGKLAVIVFTSEMDGLLLLWGKGGWHPKPPKGWEIRKDRDTATGKGDVHYHCVSKENEYVVTADGKGSHDAKTGTVLPRRLGDFLHDQLEVPLQTHADGGWAVSFMPYAPRHIIDLLDDALNAEVRDYP